MSGSDGPRMTVEHSTDGRNWVPCSVHVGSVVAKELESKPQWQDEYGNRYRHCEVEL